MHDGYYVRGLQAVILACDLNAIAVADRSRYKDLMKLLRLAVGQRREISDGFEFQVKGHGISLAEIGEWMAMERLCCPFLTLQVTTSGSQVDSLLTD